MIVVLYPTFLYNNILFSAEYVLKVQKYIKNFILVNPSPCNHTAKLNVKQIVMLLVVKELLLQLSKFTEAKY